MENRAELKQSSGIVARGGQGRAGAGTGPRAVLGPARRRPWSREDLLSSLQYAMDQTPLWR